jgi:hypothetical protein
MEFTIVHVSADAGHRPPLEVRVVLLLRTGDKRHAALPMSMVSLIADA